MVTRLFLSTIFVLIVVNIIVVIIVIVVIVVIVVVGPIFIFEGFWVSFVSEEPWPYLL
jgi:hypothetical protein